MIVDLRSDTVTRPTPAMREAMMAAPLGDDVLGDDPTVKRLEASCAALAGKAAAVFVPSGTMANQIAIAVHTRPGDEILMEADAHPFHYESGAAAAISGAQIRLIQGVDGVLDAASVLANITPPADYRPPATLLCVEDTSNRGGGTVYPLEVLDELGALATSAGLRSHVDGARVLHAVVASGTPLERRVRAFDTVCWCFSKALGAPVGSILCGDEATIHRARRMRKMMGGGMRQAGILAGAALYAMEHHVEGLADDHRRAAVLVSGLRAVGLTVPDAPTNMVYVHVAQAAGWAEALEALGVRCFPIDAGRLRLVMHRDVDDAGVAHTLRSFATVAAAGGGRLSR